MENINVKNLIRILSLVLICMFFVPTFLVSCSEQEKTLSVGQMMTGLEYGGEEIIPPHPILIFYLLLPLSLLIVWCIRLGLEEKIRNFYTLAASAADIAIWFVLKSKVEEEAERNYCSSDTTGWFWVNIVLLAVVLVLAVALCTNALQADVPLFQRGRQFSGTVPQDDGKTVVLAGSSQKEGSIECLSGEYAGAVISVGTSELIIGREESEANIIIKNREVSRRHCGIKYNSLNGNYIVTDYSTNGTFSQNGQRFTHKMAVDCTPGTILVIAQSGNKFILK